MPTDYEKVKQVVIRVIDYLSEDDLELEYGTKFSAKTKLSTLGIPRPMRGWMSRPLNKRLHEVLQRDIRNIGMIDLQETATVGAVINLACKRTATAIPQGEPT